jgi:hypothetical protein
LGGGSNIALQIDSSGTTLVNNLPLATSGAPIVINGASNIQLGSGLDVGGGVRVFGISNATTVPTTNPTNGVILYAQSGVLKFRSAAGSVYDLSASGGSFTAPTGSGLMTTTSGTMNTAASAVGSGVLTFLATPSSANLASTMTDKTGSGLNVFGTSPTLTTPVIASIVNTGTLTLPTATCTIVGDTTTNTLTNKTLTSPVLGGTPTISAATIVTSVDTKGTNTDRQPVHVQTTDATVTTLDSFTLASGTTVACSWLVSCIQSTSATAGAWSVTAVFRNNAGTVSQVGSTSVSVLGTDDAAYTCTIDNSTTTIRLRVTGKAATTLQWTGVATCLTVIP